MLEQKLSDDLKAALLAGDSLAASTIRSLKNTLLYAKVEAGDRDKPLPDETVLALLQKEAKKRQESADLYKQGGSDDRAAQELAEKAIIERYLPEKLDEKKLYAIIDEVIGTMGGKDKAAMGEVIQEVRRRSAGAADGSTIAMAVKGRLQG